MYGHASQVLKRTGHSQGDVRQHVRPQGFNDFQQGGGLDVVENSLALPRTGGLIRHNHPKTFEFFQYELEGTSRDLGSCHQLANEHGAIVAQDVNNGAAQGGRYGRQEGFLMCAQRGGGSCLSWHFTSLDCSGENSEVPSLNS
jgi:hypothetical protein